MRVFDFGGSPVRWGCQEYAMWRTSLSRVRMIQMVVVFVILSMAVPPYSFQPMHTPGSLAGQTAHAESRSQRTPPESAVAPVPVQTPTSQLAQATLAAAQTPIGMPDLPVTFVPNAGQLDSAVHFQVYGAGQSIFLTPQEVVFAIPAAVSTTTTLTAAQQPVSDLYQDGVLRLPAQDRQLSRPRPGPNPDDWKRVQRQAPPMHVARLQFLGANRTPAIIPSQQQDGVVHSFLGNTAATWRTDLPTYAGVRYAELYPGIDLQYEGQDGALKGTWVVAPGSDPTIIQWRYAGGRSTRLNDQGAIVVDIPLKQRGWEQSPPAVLTEEAPIAWQVIHGSRVPVSVSYRLFGAGIVGFTVGTYDPTQPLLIDPPVRYSTYLGTTNYDRLFGVAADATGAIYLTGTTGGSPFPSGTNAAPFGWIDAFVIKLDPTGHIPLYTAYVGGSGQDVAQSIAVDAIGQAYVAGHTDSTNFPTVNAQQTAAGGDIDAFVFKLDATGTTLLHSTPLGGNKFDVIFDIAVATDASEDVFVTGLTFSTNFPTTSGAYDTTCSVCPSDSDAFVTKLATTSATYRYSTFLGGNNFTQAHNLAVDATNTAYVADQTRATNFPTTSGAYQTTYQGGYTDAFIVKLNTAGSAITFGTYLGGASSDCEVIWIDRECAIAIDADGNMYMAGATTSTNFPTTTGAYDTTANGDSDIFVTKLNAAGNALIFSTYLGGSGFEAAHGIAVDSTGRVALAGQARASGYPTVDAPQSTFGGNWDAVATIVNATGSALEQSTYLGGSADDQGRDVAVGRYDRIVVTGWTRSTNFYTLNAVQPTYAGHDFDGFVTVFGDPVLLADDQRRCSCDPAQPQAGVGVNTRSGNLMQPFLDLQVPGRGPIVAWTRAYASQAINDVQGALGVGWQHAYDTRLIFPSMPAGEPDTIVLLTPENNRLRFFETGVDTYVAAPGILDTLEKDGSIYRQTLPDQRQFWFDATTGLLVGVRDEQGQELTLTYAGTPPQLQRIEDATDSSRYLELTTTDGFITSVTDGEQTVSYAFDGDDNLWQVEDVAGRTTTLSYDDHLLTVVENAAGQAALVNTYTGTGATAKVATQTLLDGQVITFDYTTAATTVTTTGQDGTVDVKVYAYNDENTLQSITQNGQSVLAATFDLAFQPSVYVDGNNNVTRSSYTDQGSPDVFVNALGERTTATYSAENRLLSVTDALGVTTAYAYDSQGNIISTTMGITTTSPLRRTTLYTYTYDARWPGDTQVQEMLSLS